MATRQGWGVQWVRFADSLGKACFRSSLRPPPAQKWVEREGWGSRSWLGGCLALEATILSLRILQEQRKDVQDGRRMHLGLKDPFLGA